MISGFILSAGLAAATVAGPATRDGTVEAEKPDPPPAEASPSRAAPQRQPEKFVPSESIEADKAITWPVDI
jgi:hypothetical protein